MKRAEVIGRKTEFKT